MHLSGFSMRKYSNRIGWVATVFVPTALALVTPVTAFVGSPFISAKIRSSKALFGNQLLTFQEPSTNVTVQLVGSMHYNPTSIQLVEETIADLAEKDQLGSVVIESCDIRWQTTTEMNPLLQKFLQSEMRAACEVTLDANRPVVLGDQRINITVDRMKAGFKETVVDLVRPDQGGWQRIWSNITAAWIETSPPNDGGKYLTVTEFFDPKLVLNFPISLLKYPTSYFVRAPVATLAFFSLLYFGDGLGDATTIPMDEMTVFDWTTSLSVAILELIVFARILTKELLAERNEILAKSILDQCRIYQKGTQSALNQGQNSGWFGSLFGSPAVATKADGALQIEEEIMYVPTNKTMAMTGQGGKTVVAVLGMAHCNGIAKLLKEQRV